MTCPTGSAARRPRLRRLHRSSMASRRSTTTTAMGRSMIADRYEPLENGLARDTELDRVVRLRWLADTDVVHHPRLPHPNFVRVFDIGEADGRRFAAVEHVQG